MDDDRCTRPPATKHGEGLDHDRGLRLVPPASNRLPRPSTGHTWGTDDQMHAVFLHSDMRPKGKSASIFLAKIAAEGKHGTESSRAELLAFARAPASICYALHIWARTFEARSPARVC